MIGMVSVDVPLQRLRAQLGALPDSSNLIPVLYSPEHRLVLHPDPAIAMQYDIGKLATNGGRSDLAPVTDHIRRRQDFEVKHRVGPVGDTGWSFSLSVDEGVILAQLNRITLWGVLGGLLGVLLCVAAVRRYSGMIARPIEDITNTARHFAKGEFDYPLGHTDREDEVGVLARAFDTARGSIKRQMTEIADMGAARARLEGELNIAANIQQAMLPAGSEFDAGEAHLEFHGMLEPAKAVGGDFYNLFERDGDSLWFVIGDVSDKGVPAALFMARTMTVLEVAAQLGGSPGKALREAAKHLVEGNAVDGHDRVVARDDLLRGNVQHLFHHRQPGADAVDEGQDQVQSGRERAGVASESLDSPVAALRHGLDAREQEEKHQDDEDRYDDVQAREIHAALPLTSPLRTATRASGPRGKL